MSRPRVIVSCVSLMIVSLAAAGAQELALDPRVGLVGPRALGADCSGGEIYDDGTAENGYSGNANLISDFEGVQQFTPAGYPATYDTVCVGLVSLAGPDLDFEIEVRDDDGPGGEPGTLLGTVPVSASGIPGGLPCAFYEYDISSLELNIEDGNVWIGVRWNPMTFPSRFVCADETPQTPLHPGFVNFNNPDSLWQATQTVFPNYRAKLIRAVPGVIETQVFTPDALEVDFAELSSNGNGMLEPGEQVEVAPAWTNDGTIAHEVQGTASNFTGPAGPTYDLVIDAVDYGLVAPTETASCQDLGTCYQMSVGPSGVERPSPHWDATFDESLSEESTHTWTLHIGESFSDVSTSHLFYPFVETLLHHGMTSGCGGGAFCPELMHSRGLMAMSMLRAVEGSGYTPLPCDEEDPVFADVAADDPLCPWIEELHLRGVVSGCGGGNYCPTADVTRAQMAVFVLKTLLGADYVPPDCGNVFADVPCSSLFATWIEDLFARGITAGCGNGNYCPGAPITRGQMGVFVIKAFGLAPYGP